MALGALLGSDMHLDHNLPHIWYRAVFRWTDAAGPHREAAEALAFDPTLAKCNAGDRDAIRRLAAAAD